MFTRANFDIQGIPMCTHCKKRIASMIVTNTIVNYKDELASFSSAFCNNCWNDSMENEE